MLSQRRHQSAQRNPNINATSLRRFRKAKSHTRRSFQRGFALLIATSLLFIVIAYCDSEHSHEELIDQARRRLSSSVECTDEDSNLSVVLDVVYFAIIIYSFLALAILCDTFFEPSLEQISEKLNLSEDVAGATFMAAGSSAPELFTSFSDTFSTRNSIGVGTIVGSALFNILIIVAMSAAVTPKPIKLDWRPIARDVGFYVSSIGLLVAVLVNGSKGCINYDTLDLTWNTTDVSEDYTCGGIVWWYEGLIMVFVYVLYIVFMIYNGRILNLCSKEEIKVYDVSHSADQQNQQHDGNSNKVSNEGDKNEGEGEDDDDEGPWYAVPETIMGKIYFVISLPLQLVFRATIPDCSNEEGWFYRWFISTFVMSIVWIAVACYGAVTLATKIGCSIGINPVIMGLVLLAAGTSVPDMIASMIVAKQGHADMAIANAVGSNVFDILLGLGLPWTLSGLADEYLPMVVNVDDIVPEVIILSATVMIYVLTLMINRWTMERRIGVVFTLIYVGYVAYALIHQSSDS